MTILDLLISYRWWIHLPDKQLAIHLSWGAKEVRNQTESKDVAKACRKFINCVSLRQYDVAIDSLRKGEIWHNHLESNK